MEFEFLEEEQLTLVCPRRTDDDASSGAIGAAWRVPCAIAETLAKNTAVLHRQMTPLIITLLYLSKVAWYVVRNARKLTNDIKLMAVAKIGPCVDWLKKKLCFSKGRHRYASF